TMLRMVLLPQPDGPSRATNSPSLMRNVASSTATTSRPLARKVLRSPAISMRQRAVTSGGWILGVRRLEELVGHPVLGLDRLLDAGELAVPDLFAACVGVCRDEPVPVGHVLKLADLQQVGVARGRAGEPLDGAENGLGRVGLDPLHGAPRGA